jgi:hypothetical protein
MNYWEKSRSIDSITVSRPKIAKNRIIGEITFTGNGFNEKFNLIFSYDEDVPVDESIAEMILAMPVINFTYFAGTLKIAGPVTQADYDLLKKFTDINAREVFINKICRRRYEFLKPEFIPAEEEITFENATGKLKIEAEIVAGSKTHRSKDENRLAVLSSGGKESLLSYGILRDLGSEVFPIFFNESGGHWRTALPSYRYYSNHFPLTRKIWSNVDRFYSWGLKFVKILDMDTIRKRADTYPIQVFIFPVYVFSSIPLMEKYGISGIVMGNEFDDVREMAPFKGIEHYYGVFDQSNDFSGMMDSYFRERGIQIRLWSAVYPVFGNVVERVLVHSYHDLFKLQRSCHSCHFEKGNIVPCGTCTKCTGIILFLKAAGADPTEIFYKDYSNSELIKRIESGRLRLDPDELKFLELKVREKDTFPEYLKHVRGIHLLPDESVPFSRVPKRFRDGVLKIFSNYTDGLYKINDGNWIKT